MILLLNNFLGIDQKAKMSQIFYEWKTKNFPTFVNFAFDSENIQSFCGREESLGS